MDGVYISITHFNRLKGNKRYVHAKIWIRNAHRYMCRSPHFFVFFFLASHETVCVGLCFHIAAVWLQCWCGKFIYLSYILTAGMKYKIVWRRVGDKAVVGTVVGDGNGDGGEYIALLLSTKICVEVCVDVDADEELRTLLKCIRAWVTRGRVWCWCWCLCWCR